MNTKHLLERLVRTLAPLLLVLAWSAADAGTITGSAHDFSTKAWSGGRICVACHRVFGEGVAYGPDFTGVGKRLKREEIIESILEPNAKIAAGYATTNLETAAGEAITGFIAGETAGVLSLKLPGGLVRELKTSEIKRRETLNQSSMPEGLAATMSAQEFLDLVEFLAALK